MLILHEQLHGVVLFTKAEVLAQTCEGHWKPVLYRTLNTSGSYLPLLVITYLSTPSAFKVASEEEGWRVVTYNTKITILVKGQVSSFVEPMYIIHSCKQATTVSVYTLRLIFCFSSLHTTGTKSTTFTAELFVYNPKHYLFAISICLMGRESIDKWKPCVTASRTINTIASANFFNDVPQLQKCTYFEYSKNVLLTLGNKAGWHMMTENITEMPVKPKMVEACVKKQERSNNMKLRWNEPKVVVSCLEKVLSTVFLSCLLAVCVTIMRYYVSHIKLKHLRSEFLDSRAW